MAGHDSNGMRTHVRLQGVKGRSHKAGTFAPMFPGEAPENLAPKRSWLPARGPPRGVRDHDQIVVSTAGPRWKGPRMAACMSGQIHADNSTQPLRRFSRSDHRPRPQPPVLLGLAPKTWRECHGVVSTIEIFGRGLSVQDEGQAVCRGSSALGGERGGRCVWGCCEHRAPRSYGGEDHRRTRGARVKNPRDEPGENPRGVPVRNP